ncbi:MAG: DegT/DnrJ/EryC1/StrS family aminotransferase [Gemmatimonadota bacterium]
MSKKTRLALLSGEPTGGARPARWPQFKEADIAAVVEILQTGRTVGLGRTNPVIEKAEKALSKYHGGRQVMVVNSGHAALMSALMGLEVGPGDEVITTPYTWGASTSCILHVGAIPVFVDVDPVTGLLDPKKVEAAVTRKTKAILAVHLYGQPADMPAIQRLARKRGLLVIEDGSQSHGATIDGELVGSFSDAAGFSCMGGKLLATSEAGYMLTPNEEVFWKAAMMGQHYGRSAEPGFPEEYKPFVDSLVFTFRLSPLIAALFPGQLRGLDRQVKARQQNAAVFREALADCAIVELPQYRQGVLPGYHMLTMNFRSGKAGIRRDTFLAALRAEGVGAFAYVPSAIPTWKRLHWQGYEGPVPFWLEGLKRAKVDYSRVELPHAEHKIAHGVEMGWNNYFRPDAAGMRRMARAFLKVQDNLGALREWQDDEDARARRKSGEESSVIRAARAAAAGYARPGTAGGKQGRKS